MIDIKISDVRKAGSCGFCKEGTLTPSGTNLKYPYNKVTVLETEKNSSGGGIRVNICNTCLEEVICSYEVETIV